MAERIRRVLSYGSRMSVVRDRLPGSRFGGDRPSKKMIGLGLVLILGVALLGWIFLKPAQTDDFQYTDPVTLTIHTNTTSASYVKLPNGKKCDVPCKIIRNKGDEIQIKIEADGYQSVSTKLQFLVNKSRNFSLRKK